MGRLQQTQIKDFDAATVALWIRANPSFPQNLLTPEQKMHLN
jgi:hypothetical protein